MPYFSPSKHINTGFPYHSRPTLRNAVHQFFLILLPAALLQIVSLQAFLLVPAQRKEQSKYESIFLPSPFNPSHTKAFQIQFQKKTHSIIAVRESWNVAHQKNSEKNKSD